MTSSFAYALPPNWKTYITQWLQEDVPSFDYGGYVVGDKIDTAILWGKSPGAILAGVPFFDEIFKSLDCQVEWNVSEGSGFKAGTQVAQVTGKARNILLGERVSLNVLSRCSGIASQARRVVDLAKSAGFKGCIAGTRKTTPGFRLVEKYALLVGGADTHRYDLSSLVMIKDNHIWSQGSIGETMKKAKSIAGFSLKIEVECRSESEVREAALAGADIIMMDNFQPAEAKFIAASLKQNHPNILVEMSGGITESNLLSFLDPNFDIISMGSLTQGVPHVDYSLKITRHNNI